MPLFTPIGGGGIGKATVTATTGSPTIDTTSRPGKTIYKFTNTGLASITVGTAGTAEILVVGAGGTGGNNGAGGGGGAGGYIYNASAYFPAGTHTVYVGAGGADTTMNGESSVLGPYIAVGGGAGGTYSYFNPGYGGNGGSGGGSNSGAPVGKGTPGQGYDGSGTQGGGAGGSSGAGVANSITGTSVIYATGGSSTAGNSSGTEAANTGNGGRGGNDGNYIGGSGIVVMVIG